MKKKCQQCGKEYNTSSKTSKFCGKNCYKKYLDENKKKKVICKYCKKEFTVYLSSNRKFCSKRCSDLINSTKVLKKCKICGKEFLIKKSRVNVGCGKYCSNKCKVKGYIGFKHSKETKDKLKNCKKGSWSKENNPKWNGGVSTKNSIERGSKKTKLWKKSIFELFNFTCQRCKKRGGDMEAHHILNWSSYEEKRHDINNGILFCKICHKEFHKKYGKENNNIYQIKEFINIYEK